MIELVDRARRGDADAFSALYRENAGRVYALCLRLEADAARAEELTQDVFVRAWERLTTFRGESAFSTWLHRLAVNVVLTDRRAAWRRGRREFTTDDVAMHETAAETESPGARMDLDQAIAALPDGARAIFVLHDVEGYDHREIGKLVGIAERHIPRPALPRPPTSPQGTRPMTCELVRDQIDAYVAGALPLPDRAELEAHLATCPACAEDVRTARTLSPLTRALAPSIAPPHNLWPAIAQRLPGRSRGVHPGIRRRTAALLAAAAIVLVIASSAVTLAVVRARDQGGASQVPAIEAGYVSASASLFRAIESERSGLSPETIATLERNLAIIDAAIAESKAALAGDPGNRALAALLWASYRQKVSLLQQVSRLVERS